MNSQHKNPLHSIFKIHALWPFSISIVYWTYLFFSTQTIIIFDSLDYQALGQIIQADGWIKYFETGPNREPFYPLLISTSMYFSKLLTCSYLPILKFIQLLILLSAQILSLKVLQKLKINSFITTTIILYIGFSPALINTALSLYSEIITYPFILGIIILSEKLYTQLTTKKKIQHLLPTIMGLSFCLTASTFSKSIFEIITPFYLIVFLFLLLQSKKSSLIQTILAISLSFLFFYIPVSFYKSMNKKYNGQYVLTNRGAWALYGNTARRMKELTFKKVLTAITYAPGEGVCLKFFDKNNCNFWSFQKSDELGYGKLHELTAQKLSNEKREKILLIESRDLILSNPFQYGLFYIIEGFKTVFWESTQIGFVKYPPGLTKLYIWTPFKDGLRLFMSLFTFLSIVYTLIFLFKNKTHPAKLILFYILCLLFLHAGFYSFFFILTRYSLPVAPLYLILIAFTFNEILFNEKKNIKNE